jgi:hypothetical protein
MTNLEKQEILSVLRGATLAAFTQQDSPGMILVVHSMHMYHWYVAW